MDKTKYNEVVSNQQLQCICGQYMYSIFDRLFLVVHGVCVDCTDINDLNPDAERVWDYIAQYG